ncbi:MAG TPA: outer membrane lipoprotein carrier protein LolA [Candidatus Hydrogenedens sp.]|nr:outer membrane lipoprotein carrier protein LolA [Candidatus Hydrogenedens sp.]
MMKKTTDKPYKHIFYLLSLITIQTWMYAQYPVENKDIDNFFQKYTESRDKIQILVADFIQKSIYPDESYITKGTLVFIKPRRIVFHTDEPEKYTLVENTKIYEYEPEIKQMTIYDLKDQVETELFFFAFAQNLDELRKKYHVTPIQLSEERGKHGISIRPYIDKEQETQFEEIILYLRDEDYLPYRLRIINEDNIQTIIDFEKIEINGKIRREDTQIFVPQGTNIIENDKQKEIVPEDGKRIPEPASVDPKYIDNSINPVLSTGDKNKETKKPSNLVDIEVKDLEPPNK